MSLATLLGLNRPDEALVARVGDAWRSWRDLKGDVAPLTARLLERREPRVGLFCQEAYPFAVALLAAWRAGKTVCLPGHDGAAPSLGLTLWLGDEGLTSVPRQPILAGGQAPLPPAAPLPDEALVVLTSGSTGEPKLIVKHLRQLDAELATLERVFGPAVEGAVVLSTVSQQHLYGFLFRLAWPLLAGRPFASETPLFPAQWYAQTLQHERVVWVSSPAHYKRLPDDFGWAQVRGRVCQAFSSGGVLPKAVAVPTAERLGCPVAEIFGSSETGGVAWRDDQGPWRPLPGVEVDRRAEDGALLLRSPHLDPGSFQAMDDGIELVPGGFTVRGRLDRVVKVEEKRVALPEIEAALADTGLVAQAHALLLDDHGRQAIGAAVVLTGRGRELVAAGAAGLKEALRAGLVGRLPAVALPRKWRFVEALPADGLGKVTRAAVAGLFRDEHPRFSGRPLLPKVEAVRRDESGVTLTLAMDPQLAVFDGHFDEVKILAGVAQVDFAVRLGRAHFTLPREFSRLEVIKFQRVIQPGDVVDLKLTWDEKKKKLYFTYTSPKGVHASGRILLARGA